MKFHNIIENNNGNLRLNINLRMPGVYVWRDDLINKHLYIGCNENDTITGTLYSRFDRGIRGLMGTLNINANGESVDWQEYHALENHLCGLNQIERKEYIISHIRFGFCCHENREALEHHFIEIYDPLYNKDRIIFADNFRRSKSDKERYKWSQMIKYHNDSWPTTPANDPLIGTVFGLKNVSTLFDDDEDLHHRRSMMMR